MKLLGMFAVLFGIACSEIVLAQSAVINKEKKILTKQAKETGVQKIHTSGFSYALETAPTWVQAVIPDGKVSALANAPIQILLSDEQIKIEKNRAIFFNHVVKQINASAGLGLASQIQIEFDPSYQELILHKFELIRNSTRIDKFDVRRVQLLQREKQLEARMYDGRVTASIVLDDVRIGDVIEYSYTVRGSNPVFDSKFAYVDYAGSSIGPTAMYQLRLIYPEERRIYSRFSKPIQAQTIKTELGNELILVHKNIPQNSFEEGTAVSAYIPQLVQLSEFADWADVARWGEQLFSIAYQQNEKLSQHVESWKQLPSNEEKLNAALNFVQKDVRYFGTEIGVNSHKPNLPQKVLAQRYGDCKDKTTLLIALLKTMNIAAKPVLVSTTFREDTGELLPSPLAFNHVIAQVGLDDQRIWLDATRDQQSGSVLAREVRDYGKVLLADAQTNELQLTPSSIKELHSVVEDKFSLKTMKNDVALVSTTTYYGAVAEGMRDYLAHTPISEVQANYAKPYLRPYPKLRFDGELKILELKDQNAVQLLQAFSLREFWAFQKYDILKAELAFWSLEEQLNPPKDVNRKTAYKIPSAGVYQHKIISEFSEDLMDTYKEEKFVDGQTNFTLNGSYVATPNLATWSSELRYLTSTVSPAQWRSYTDKIKQVRPRFFGNLQAHALSKEHLQDLEKELKTVKSGSRMVTIPLHETSKIMVLYINAMIASGRLSPELKKQALAARAEATLNLGLYDYSVKDINEALDLSVEPDLTVLKVASLVAISKERDDAASDFIKQIVEIAPHDKDVGELNVILAYLRKDFLNVVSMSSEQLGNRDAQYAYLGLLRYLANRDSGVNDDTLIKQQIDDKYSDETIAALLQYFLGKKSMAQLQAQFDSQNINLGSLCQIYFFAGEKMRLDGDLKKAREYWKNAVASGMAHRIDYMMAARRLKEFPEK